MKALTFTRDIFRKYPVSLVLNTVLVMFVSVIEACALFTIGPLIDILINPGLQNTSPLTRKVMAIMDSMGLPMTLGSYLGIFVVFITLSCGFRIFARYSILRTTFKVLRDLVLGTFEDFFHARWFFFASNKQGRLFNIFMHEFSIVSTAFSAMAFFFAGFLQLIFYLAIPFYISWQVTAVSLAAALIFMWPFLMLGKISYRLGAMNTASSNQMGVVIQEGFSLAKVILGFGNQRRSYDNLRKTIDKKYSVNLKSRTLSVAIPLLYQPFGLAVLIAALFAARHFGVALSEMAVLLLALLRSVFLIGKLVSSKNQLENFYPSYEQINNLSRRARELRQRSGGRKFSGFNKDLSVENITFAYPGHKPVLTDINVKIPKGKMIAIAGESGSGKSTLIDMVMGFNEPMRGRIAFDGVNLFDFDIYSYREKIGYVPQDSILFNATIKENLIWAKDDAGDEELKYACRLANADEFIERLPRGYDTPVGDRGVRLSGGERQRIALARAVLRKPELLILDEATSSLDSYSEKLIQEAILNITKETTIVVIAHRLSTIMNADYIYVLKEGRIIEEGTYEDLIRTNNHFNRMVKLQLLETP